MPVMLRRCEKLPIKVHLGAFDQIVEGWLNTDITPHLFIARIPLASRLLYLSGRMPVERYRQHRAGIFRRLHYLDLRRKLPFADNSVRAFFSSHVLEHLYFDEVKTLLKEVLRCLEPGGVFRIVVPDLDAIVGMYDSQDPLPFLHAIFEAPTRRSLKNSHHFAFTGPFMLRLLTEVGFSRQVVTGFHVGDCPDLHLLDIREKGSLFCEAVK